MKKGSTTQTPDLGANTSENSEQVKGTVFGDSNTYNLKEDTVVVKAELPDQTTDSLAGDLYEYSDTQIQDFIQSRKKVGDLETESFPWSLDISYKKYESDFIVSYIVQGYEYTGGAHGNSYLQAFNYDKKTGKKIGVENIVSSKDTFDVLAALADKALVVEYPEGSNNNPKNWSVWYSDNGSVTFIFAPYQIAPYAVGQQEFNVVTTGDNANLFNSKYFK